MNYKFITFSIALIFTVSFNGQTLEDYIEIALKNSSEIEVKNYELLLAKEKVNEVGNIENTQISTGYYISTPETRVGAQSSKFGIQQKFSWFGTLNTEKDVENSIAETKQFDVDLSKRDLIYKVKVRYYELYQKKAIHLILKENEQILKTYESMSLVTLENNKTPMSDVLRIRIQKNELRSKIFKNSNEDIALSKNFNRLLQRKINTQIAVSKSLNASSILLPKLSLKEHPTIKKIQEFNNVYTKNIALVKKEKLPKLTVGLDYVLVDKRNDVSIIENGKDILMPTVAFSIPIFSKKYTSKISQLKIQQKALISKKEQQQSNLEIALEQALLDFKNALVTITAAKKNKTEVQNAINVDLKAYETGILNYDKILQLQLQKIKYQLLEIEATKNAFIAKATSEYLTD